MPVPGEHPIPHARRLHDRGVALLPVWAVEYSVLRQPARAFVSAMRAGPDPRVAGVTLTLTLSLTLTLTLTLTPTLTRRWRA